MEIDGLQSMPQNETEDRRTIGRTDTQLTSNIPENLHGQCFIRWLGEIK